MFNWKKWNPYKYFIHDLHHIHIFYFQELFNNRHQIGIGVCYLQLCSRMPLRSGFCNLVPHSLHDLFFKIVFFKVSKLNNLLSYIWIIVIENFFVRIVKNFDLCFPLNCMKKIKLLLSTHVREINAQGAFLKYFLCCFCNMICNIPFTGVS